MALALVFATSAQALPYKPKPALYPEKAKKHGPRVVKRYLTLRLKVIREFGWRKAGRNRLLQGRLEDGKVSPATTEGLQKSIARMDRWLNPPPPVYTASSAPAPAPAPAPTSGSYVIPESIVQCESGGDYSAVNPTSGAYGAYQILPQHWGSWGTCTDLDRSPAGQDACAARIWESAGASAWVC